MTLPAAPLLPDAPAYTAASAVLTDTALGLPAPASTTCANCLAPLGGDFCSACGAPSLDRRPITVGRFVGDLMNEVTNVDSLTMRTLRSLLTRPGELTREYLAGRTRWYLSPLRTFVLMFALALFAQELLPNPDAMWNQIQSTLIVKSRQQEEALRAKLAASHAKPTTREQTMLGIDPVESSTQVVTAMRIMVENQWIQLVTALMWGVVLAVLYRRRRRNFAEHLVFAMHLMAFNFLLTLADYAVRSLIQRPLNGDIGWPEVVHWAAIGSYFFLATRRLYAESKPKAATKTVLFVAGAQGTMMAIQMCAFLYAGLAIARRESREGHGRPKASLAAPAITPAAH